MYNLFLVIVASFVLIGLEHVSWATMMTDSYVDQR